VLSTYLPGGHFPRSGDSESHQTPLNAYAVKRISSRESIHKRTTVVSIPGEKRDRETLVDIISPPPNQKKKAASSSVEPTDLVVVEEETKQNRQTEASQKKKRSVTFV
jgi:hypothetical protein